ncbi:SMI1/KNR4 family protein [Clostridium sp. UBA6640]|uniref:SMI1/KNR4 family protein n=1 Tax=Clostridium sp. UBA6640 TaxID=1946370 RepID=UPI0025BCD51F|nr:SMI1/KNR4 family protein [Clostridium sp. UBA6640]
MNILPNGLEEVLSDNIYLRSNKDEVIKALKELNISPLKEFIQFYTTYAGPFWEEPLGVELMDIVEENNNIVKSTSICRDEYGFNKKYLVLTKISANEVIVLDSETDKVYRVNFEGGDELLQKGELNEEWSSFSDFLKEYFDC